MKALLCAVFFVAPAAFGQIITGTVLPIKCEAAVSVTPILRTEGLTELIGDLALTCTGGTPTPLGQPIPAANITVLLNTAVTSREFPPYGDTEAILIIDQPGSGAVVPSSNWTPRGCVPPATCTIQSNGTGAGNFSGSVGHENVFQGVVDGNSVTFQSVPILPPGTTGPRVFRITNVRVDAAGLAITNPGLSGLVIATISATPTFTISPSQLTVGTIAPGAGFGGKAGTNQFCQSLGLNGNSDAPSNGQSVLNFQELFAGAFKTPAQEGGTILPASAGLSALIGTADHGTILGATMLGLQPGLNLVLPQTQNLIENTTGAIGGSAVASSPTGTMVGNNLVVTGNSTGAAQINWELASRTLTANPVSMNPTLTLSGTPGALTTPANLFAFPRFVNPPNEPPTYALALMSNTLVYPFVTSPSGFDTGLANPSTSTDPFLIGGTIYPCVDSGNSLNLITGQAPPKFVGALPFLPTTPGGSQQAPATTASSKSAIVPRVFNVPIVSAGLPTTGVTVTANPPAPWLNVTLSDTTTPLTVFLSANIAVAGNYSTTLQFSAPGGLTLAVPVTYTVAPAPWFTIYGFAHSASYVNTVVAPGEPFVIFGGDGFGPATLAGPALDANGFAVKTLGNTQVMFDGTPAPLYYAVDNNGTGQIAGFAPFELAGKTTTNVQVVYNGVTSPIVQLAVIDAVPGLYTADTSGGGQGAILNHDLTVNSASNPEALGNLVVLYGGGAGQTSPPGRDGGLAGVGAPLATLTLPVQVFIDGIAAAVQYSGPAPGLVEGVFQINAIIPAGVRHTANVPVTVVVDGKQSQPGVTLATK